MKHEILIKKTKVEISFCSFCAFHKHSETASTYTRYGKCILGLVACDKDGGMLFDPDDFGCVAWKEKQGEVR